ncbi:MAG: hypothetical protein COA94_07190 [Rickettsiales bacterium]|nr:MAG: hypothetical protein COA94_07190 [Rickettsiales bacterium]
MDTHTKLVDVHVKYLRGGNQEKTYDNLREWIDDKDNVYIGRQGRVNILDKNKTSKVFGYGRAIFANPNSGNPKLGEYRKHIENLIEEGTITIADIINLDGKNLGCWCVKGKRKGGKDDPERCHGNILMDILNDYRKMYPKYSN